VKKFLVLLMVVAMLVPTLGPARPSQAQDNVTLTMWTWKAVHIPGLEAVGEAFTAETGIEVNFEFFNPDDVYRTRLQTAGQAGDLPDIVAYWSNGQWDLAASDLLVDISDQVDDEWAASFLPGTFEDTSVWTQQKYDDCQANAECMHSNLEVGQIYSVPLTAGSFDIVYANKSMLEEAGLDPNMVPANTDEFLDMMSQVHEATDMGATIGGKFEDIIRNWVVSDLIMTNCGPERYTLMINGDPDASFTEECSQQAFSFVGDMAERDLWQPGFQTLTIDEADTSFAHGEAAFLFGGSFTLGFLLQQGMSPDDIQVFTLPAMPSSLQNPIALAPFSLIDVAVTQHSDHPEEALQFIRFLTQPDQAATFARITGDLPGVAIPTDPEVVGDAMSKLAGAYSSAAESYRASDAWAPLASNDVWVTLDRACNRQVTGEGTLEDSLNEADEAARYDRSLREG
jgi:multiple sugar transport system substrate-binding protein